MSGQTGEALAVLADLEARDLMPDAPAWAALARLRELHGDGVGHERAVARCLAIAQDRTVCASPNVKLSAR